MAFGKSFGPKINMKPKGEIGIPKVHVNKGFKSFTKRKPIPKMTAGKRLIGNLKF